MLEEGKAPYVVSEDNLFGAVGEWSTATCIVMPIVFHAGLPKNPFIHVFLLCLQSNVCRGDLDVQLTSGK